MYSSLAFKMGLIKLNQANNRGNFLTFNQSPKDAKKLFTYTTRNRNKIWKKKSIFEQYQYLSGTKKMNKKDCLTELQEDQRIYCNNKETSKVQNFTFFPWISDFCYSQSCYSPHRIVNFSPGKTKRSDSWKQEQRQRMLLACCIWCNINKADEQTKESGRMKKGECAGRNGK